MPKAFTRFAFIFLCQCCGFQWDTILNAQTDTSHMLRTVEVTAQRIDITDIGKHTDHLDSQAVERLRYDNLASLLSNNSPLFVRNYGPGTLATLGIRGGSAAHTQILWNGIPVRNPMIGLVDLSLIPVAFIDEAEIHYGGHGAAFGSGAVGGLISVNNEQLNSLNTIELASHIGSWKNRSGQLKLNYGNRSLRLSTRIFSQNADNDFRYRLAKDLPEKIQAHHHLNNFGLLQEIYFPFSERQSLTARFWYQKADRQIPPTSTQNTSKAAQQDRNLRTSLQWDLKGEKIQWQVKTAWLDEVIDYQDTLILLYTHNRFKTWLAEAGASMFLTTNLHFTAGIYTENSKGESLNYNDILSREQTALYSSLLLVTGDMNWRLQAREETTDGNWSPPLVDLSAEWSGFKRWMLKTSFSRNYRAPALNDLYWRPGGNPGLLPEEGWTYEAGINYSNDNSYADVRSSLTFYTRRIDNWIMWMPPVKDVNIVWSPVNVAKVKSEGFEARSDIEWHHSKVDVTLRLGFDFTWSTFRTPLPEFGITAGEQLFYVPVENGFTGLNLSFGRIGMFYDHHFFGAANGINDPIKPFHIGQAGITHGFGGSHYSGSLFFHVDNVWDTSYRIVERRPMPARSFAGGVKFMIK